jgi:translation initiation factor IF-1
LFGIQRIHRQNKCPVNPFGLAPLTRILCITRHKKKQEVIFIAAKDFIEIDATIEKVLPGLKFKAILENGAVVEAHPSGKMKMNKIKIIEGDKVRIEISPYDLTKGRITFRYK